MKTCSYNLIHIASHRIASPSPSPSRLVSSRQRARRRSEKSNNKRACTTPASTRHTSSRVGRARETCGHAHDDAVVGVRARAHRVVVARRARITAPPPDARARAPTPRRLGVVARARRGRGLETERACVHRAGVETRGAASAEDGGRGSGSEVRVGARGAKPKARRVRKLAKVKDGAKTRQHDRCRSSRARGGGVGAIRGEEVQGASRRRRGDSERRARAERSFVGVARLGRE